MPISFACSCGKAFRVKDEYVGKRTKCPSCGSALLVPAGRPAADEEDEAYRLLTDGPEPARSRPPEPASPTPTPAVPAEPARDVPPKPGAKIRKKRKPKVWQSDLPRITISPAVMGGFAGLVIGGVLIYLAWDSGRVSVRGMVVAGFGLLAVVRGFFGAEEE